MKKLISAILVLVLALSCLAGCAGDLAPAATTTVAPTQGDNGTTPPEGSDHTDPPVVEDQLKYEAGTTLRMATGYNSAITGLTFAADQIPEGGLKLSNGQTYNAGDLKPTWQAIEKELGIKFNSVYTGKSASKEFDYWKEQLDQVDMISGSTSTLNEYGVAGKLVNIAEHLDKMPNFKAYLDANPIVLLSITGNTDTGAIYVSPYFDGVDDIERMPLMRTDWVEKLLNGEGEFTATASKKLNAYVYTPYMPTSGKVEIDVVKKDGSGVEKVTKDYDKAGNIVATMNAAGELDGVAAVNMLRKYIDEAYNGYYGTNRADLFIGQNAAWDADELVALLRCVVANPQTLNGTESVMGIFSREDNNNQRKVDMFRFAGTLFGVRGLESRQDYLYVGADGLLHDARQEAATYEALERMNALAKEGLISESFINNTKESSSTMLENDLGFMHYDYNQTQTILNETKLNQNGQTGEKYMAVMVPVARWFDGTNDAGVYMRFTESWRSVKTDAWAISVDGIAGDENKLNACLKLIDYAYSYEGKVRMSYGPDEFIKMENGQYVTFDFNGEQMPVIAETTYDELWSLAKGNYTNYARQYLGSTLSFAKSQAFEYQCTHTVGKEGAGYISNAIKYGTIKHPVLALYDENGNTWYASIPTIIPTTKDENAMLKTYTELTSMFSTSKGEDQVNIFVNQIVGGYTVEGVSNADSAAAKVANEWNGVAYLKVKQDAYNKLASYYMSLVG